jgi:hypothetical protein
MKKFHQIVIALSLLSSAWLEAQPTSLFWTNCTTDVQPTGSANIEVYNYFTVFNRRGHGSAFPPDVGFLVGLFTWKDLSAEAGIDYLGGTDDPLFFNTKIGMPEDKLFHKAPSFSVGIFNIGTRTRTRGRTNQNIANLVLGKSLPKKIGGHLFFGGFGGNRAMGKNRGGFWVGYARPFGRPGKDCHGKEYDRWIFEADYASGKNTIGGGGFALCYYFCPTVYIETGPVWFNSAKINGSWKWSVQLYMTIPLLFS